jgi:hypothetical protein
MVSSTTIWLMVIGSTVTGFALRTTKSASFPGSIEPLVFSSKISYADQSVIALSPSIGVRRSSAPTTLPLRDVRFTVAHITCIRFGNATGASEWLLTTMPLRSAVPIGAICCAHYGPTVSGQTSPQ